MSLTCIHQVSLDYTDGTSDKVYIVQVQEEDLGGGSVQYIAAGYYGRRGSSLSKAEKYKGPNKASAQAAADRLEREKRGKGYGTMTVAAGTAIPGMPAGVPVFGGASTASSTPSTPKKTLVGTLPMLAQVLNASELEEVLASDEYGAQIKYDGERVMVHLRRSGITASNRKGELRPLTAAAELELKKLLALPDFGDERLTVLDGELMGDMYVAYDVVTLRDNDMRPMSCEERYASLEMLLDDHRGLLAPMAWSEEEKRALKARAEAEDMEGIMFRRLDAEYKSARVPSLLKHKLWATCTCRVLTVNAKRSIQVALRDESDDEVFVGNVTVPVNQDIPEVDSLVEVRYLYAMDGGSLYQPTLKGPRNDIDECDRRADLRQAPPEKRGAEAVTPEAEAA